WTMKEYMDYMEKWMQESQKIAEYVALKKAGYNPQILGDGAQIVGIMPNSPSKGILFPGDIIRKVDNEPVSIADEVIEKVANRNIGEVVELEVEREDNTLTLSLPTIESQTEPGKAIVGIYITTLNWKPALPLNIEINTGKIGGPSAGCMFVLEILNQLTPEDLAQGRKIAGTGTISLDETIGEIGGVEQKVVAAYRAGAEIFIVPEKNAEAAIKAAKGYDIEVVSVKNLDDVLNYLEEL
ncbi:MAG: S16 family serine protease, partial [Tepidanaerobacteraceae bacterium]